MYVCPTCQQKFEDVTQIANHSLHCWRKHNPNHVAKPAPCKGNTTERYVNEDIMTFFKGWTCQK